MTRGERARMMVATLTRMSYWMVAFLLLCELASLPVAASDSTTLVVDLAAMAITGMFALAVWIGPGWALRLIDRETRPRRGEERIS